MSDFDAPSFSLGLDLDLEAPSFSLGLDLDLDVDPPLPPTNPPPDSSTNEVLEEDEQVAADSDPDLGPEPPRVLRRLRRGIGTPGPSSSASASVAERVSEELRFHGPNGDDDIEDFSSQEGIVGDVHPLTQYNSVCSTSKAPLHQPRILMTKSSNQSKSKKEKQASHANVFASMGTKNDILMFPKLTSSPLRRFQLIDSDSDDSCVDIDMKGKAHATDPSIKARQSNYGCNAAFVSVPQNKDQWKYLCPMSSKIPTPAFDEVFEEYHSAKNKKPQNLGGKLPTSSQKGLSIQNDGPHGDPNSSLPLPPAHYYFFNDDPRIQELVRSRLPNFFPLGVTSSEENRQSAASIIDYTCQFTNGETSKKPWTRNVNREGSSTRRKKSKGSSAKETSQEWVNPRQTASSPKDAGKRRVQADGQSTGHWYSGAGGKKVYVNKNGQELTGRIAYQQYKKENGSGFKKSKKKTNTKKRKR